MTQPPSHSETSSVAAPLDPPSCAPLCRSLRTTEVRIAFAQNPMSRSALPGRFGSFDVLLDHSASVPSLLSRRQPEPGQPEPGQAELEKQAIHRLTILSLMAYVVLGLWTSALSASQTVASLASQWCLSMDSFPRIKGVLPLSYRGSPHHDTGPVVPVTHGCGREEFLWIGFPKFGRTNCMIRSHTSLWRGYARPARNSYRTHSLPHPEGRV